MYAGRHAGKKNARMDQCLFRGTNHSENSIEQCAAPDPARTMKRRRRSQVFCPFRCPVLAVSCKDCTDQQRWGHSLLQQQQWIGRSIHDERIDAQRTWKQTEENSERDDQHCLVGFERVRRWTRPMGLSSLHDSDNKFSTDTDKVNRIHWTDRHTRYSLATASFLSSPVSHSLGYFRNRTKGMMSLVYDKMRTVQCLFRV